jgi:hypothetical protein
MLPYTYTTTTTTIIIIIKINSDLIGKHTQHQSRHMRSCEYAKVGDESRLNAYINSNIVPHLHLVQAKERGDFHSAKERSFQRCCTYAAS